MKVRIPSGIAEALRLTRAGKLNEATAAIQRTLGGVLPGVNASPATQSKESAPGVATVPVRPARPESERARAPASPLAGAQARGRLVDGSVSNRAGTRGYKLYVPSGYVGQAVPLVVMLHGCTQTVVDAASGTRLNMLAEVDGFLVVYPEQAPAANRSKCWNWFQPADQQRDAGEPSLIADITRQVMATYHVDAGRVYVAGMSAGGAMAAILGATYPDLFAAVGVHSGLARGAARDLQSGLAAMRQGAAIATHSGGPGVARGVPTIVFHGDRDTTVNPRNGEQVLAQALALSAADGPKRTVSEGRVPNGHSYTRSLYRDARGNVVGEHWLVHGAGHAWSGGSPSGSFTDPRGPDASKEMLRFFRKHPRAELASGS
jgi:poly(hydroxyalkanoate) depolymerase family esterase